MNDKQQLAAMGEHLAEQPICLQKRVEQLEALLREARDMMGNQPRGFSGMMHRIDEALGGAVATVSSDPTRDLVWRNTGSPNGLRRFMTQKQYDAQTPGVQKWYEPIRYEAPEGWKLVPVVPTESMILHSVMKTLRVDSIEDLNDNSGVWAARDCVNYYKLMLAAAPKPGDVDA